jgi:glutamate synthase domain-containing protein 3
MQLTYTVRNTMRAIGTRVSSHIVRKYGMKGLNPGQLTVKLTGSAGQSLGAFAVQGVKLKLYGDSNDYVGKGLSGGTIIVRPMVSSQLESQDNVIIGNTVLYGATAGRAFFRGRAGERFAVRNSGAEAVVEGVGDHGCEYMTGGLVVVLGSTGRNFAAGMSGGIAYVLDRDGGFAGRCNRELVELEPIEEGDAETIRRLVQGHLDHTGSPVAAAVLAGFDATLAQFVKVMPRDYKRALAELDAEGVQVDDHPVSSGGEGFLTTESEEAVA